MHVISGSAHSTTCPFLHHCSLHTHYLLHFSVVRIAHYTLILKHTEYTAETVHQLSRCPRFTPLCESCSATFCLRGVWTIPCKRLWGHSRVFQSLRVWYQCTVSQQDLHLFWLRIAAVTPQSRAMPRPFQLLTLAWLVCLDATVARFHLSKDFHDWIACTYTNHPSPKLVF